MTRLRLYTLGAFQVILDGQALRGFASDKERALLAWLALKARDRPVRRETLMRLFWDGFTEETARHSLRNALYGLRKLLAPLDLLHTTRQTVQLDTAHPSFWCDALALEAAADDESASMEQVEKALALARGELLHGLELRDCPGFDAWLAGRRQHVAAQVARLEARRTRLAAAQASPPPGFLPRPATPFFGREQELKRLAQKLVNPGSSLVTILGEGGIGKTRLALALAEQVRAAFPGGVWFVPLANLSPGEGALGAMGSPAVLGERLASAIAARLALQLSPGALPADQIAQRLPSQRLLLVLDNFEHLHGAEPFLVDLLQAAPNLYLLVTSRRRLDLQAEYAFRLAGLPVPPQAAPGQPSLSLDALQSSSSVHLFAERADRRCGGFELDEHNQQAVAQICRLVEGMPLGIELAAALTDQYSCAEIASAVAATVDILASSMADLAPQHRSLRAVFETSWRLLAQPEQAALARCAVFRGGFSPEAAAVVAGASPKMLAGLADKSLLRQMDETRYDMHDLLRQLAAEKLLDEPGAREATAAQHCAWYARFLHARANDLFENPELMAAAWEETFNLKIAWLAAIDQRDAAALRQMARGMAQLLHSRGLFQQAVAQLAAAAAVLRAGLADTAEGR
ncbi:MAG TPA: AAA family ATPase, partial [Anaerolineae bacterium]|nr:AAA family ATPase [Anaerolineae bacterium]